jgi:hypothetical protein
MQTPNAHHDRCGDGTRATALTQHELHCVATLRLLLGLLLLPWNVAQGTVEMEMHHPRARVVHHRLAASGLQHLQEALRVLQLPLSRLNLRESSCS